MRTANPALNDSVFRAGIEDDHAERMTIGGAVAKTFILVSIAVAAAAYVWMQYFGGKQDVVISAIPVGAIGGLIVAIATIFRPKWSPVTAPLYAVLQGVALGGISATFEASFAGLPLQAVGLTFSTLLALLAAYTTGLIKASENFRLAVFAATAGIALFYILSVVLGVFGIMMPLLHSGGWMGIGFSLFVVGVAALNLVLDFDFIENGAESGAPKHMEWYAAFGLLVTLVWLYLEMLRLLAKLQSRD